MSGQQYEPGTVASIATEGNSKRVVGIRSDSTGPGCPSWQTGHGYVLDSAVTDVRPLIVLDEPDFYYETAVPELRAAAREGGRSLRLNRILDSIADQIQAQTPKPKEPTGLGAVVENTRGYKYVRVADPIDGWAHGRQWQRIGGDINAVRNFGWEEIDAVRVLSEGVQP